MRRNTNDKININLRPARRDDLSEIQALFVDTIRSTCKNDYSQEQIMAWTSSVENKVRWTAAVDQQFFLVAEKENRIIGFASLKNGDYLDFMYVHQACLRQGIADRLYTALENESKRLGCTFIVADVSKTARPFFESKGFKVLKVNQHLIRGVEIINYRMRKN